MNRLVLAGLASLALVAGAVASPPIVPPTTRPRMPGPPVPPTYPARPPAGVIVVPTTPGPRPYFQSTTIRPYHMGYAVYYRSGPFWSWHYYGSYMSWWMAEEIRLELEYYYGLQTMIR